MRGKRGVKSGIEQVLGNIPAYAGKTWLEDTTKNAGTEHPRVCGENGVCAEVAIVEAGTSPRMRGKPAKTTKMGKALRNIPAYAGKTPPRHLSHLVPGEHPRVCGENGGGCCF